MGVGGYILQASAWNVIGVYNSDANLENDVLRSTNPLMLARSRSASGSFIELGGDRGPLPNISNMSPSELLNRTNADSDYADGVEKYNEIALQGTSAFGTKIKVTAIFVKVKKVEEEYLLLELIDHDTALLAPSLLLYSEEMIKQMKIAAQKLPIVAIIDNNPSLYLSKRKLSEIGEINNIIILD